MSTFTEKLPVDLTPEEHRMKADELARTIDHRARMTEQKRQSMAKYSELLKGYDKQIGDLAVQIREGVEYREVPCTERQNFETNCVEIIRVDTGAVIRHETMTAKQRQKELFDPAPLDAVTEAGTLSEQYEELSKPIDGPGDDEGDDEDAQPYVGAADTSSEAAAQ